MNLTFVCGALQTGRAALLRGLNFWRRGSAALPLIVINLLAAAGPAASAATNDLSDAEVQGRALAQQLLEQHPTENFTNAGVLNIRAAKVKSTSIPMKFEVVVTATNWRSGYQAGVANQVVTLSVVHAAGQANEYFYRTNSDTRVPLVTDVPVLGHLFRSPAVSGATLMVPFAGSDFWIADLGLEFFHWPEQKILKSEMRRGRSCKVLESLNPDAAATGYTRVDSWIDNETLGIVHAEAYDAKGKLLKEFDPKSFKKVNGQWELQDMDIRNVQTGSRTRLEFDLKAR